MMKKFILGITLFVSGLIGAGLNLTSNSIVLQSEGNNVIPFAMFIVTLGTEYSNLRVQTDYRIIPTIYYQGSEVKQYTVSQYQSWVEDSNKNIYVPGNLSNTTYVYNENGGLITSVDSFEINSGWPSYINIFVNEHEHNMNYGPILIPYDPEVDRGEEIEMEFDLYGCASWMPSND